MRDKNHHKIIIDKTNSFLNPSKRKNFFKDNINNNNNINNNKFENFHLLKLYLKKFISVKFNRY